MRHLKLFSLLSVPWLALFAAGCGSGNSIGHTAQNITFDNPGTQTVGEPLTLSATTNSGLTASFTSATPSVCTVSGTTVTFGAAGTCSIDASVSGNSTYAAASQVAQSFTVNPAIGPTTTIYIAGSAVSTASTPSNVVNVAEEWKLTSGSPTATATALSMPSGMTSSQAHEITVSGNDVYVAGYASNGTNQVPVLWVNGAATILPTSMTISRAGPIAVSGGNVYVSGNSLPNVGNQTALFWQNGGAATTLPIPPNDTAQDYGAGATAVSGNDVYVTGDGVSGATGNSTAAYWLNGTATSLPLPTNTLGSPATSFALGVGFSGSDVYMVGSAGQYAVYWVDGGAGTLLPMPSGTYQSGANAIAVTTQ